jgi:hypothetical protein
VELIDSGSDNGDQGMVYENRFLSGFVLLFTSLIWFTLPWSFGHAETKAARGSESFATASSASASSIQNQALTLIALLPMHSEGATLVQMAVYDDAKTERRGDVAVIYGVAGEPLILSWFDRFGIRRIAVDRGLLEANRLEGVFVVLIDGEPL